MIRIRTNQSIEFSDKPSADLESWLYYEKSLTNKLQIEAGEARLQLLKQEWLRPNWWDKYTLNLSTQAVMHREILMSAGQQPCWYARTVIPDFSYQNNPFFFDKLQHQSLGELIFLEPEVKRITLQNYAINKQSLEYYWLPDSIKEKKELYWLRFSSFTFKENSPFYLVEILLPELLRVIK